MADQSTQTFAGLLRELRAEAGLTQEELAHKAGLSPRSISDLERGVNLTARMATARLLAEALDLTGPRRARFEAAARGRIPAEQVPATGEGAAAATRALPRDVAGFTGRTAELAQLVGVVTGESHGGGVVHVCAVGGMAGVGKTTFAVHAAHRLAGAFPDGQFFLPLHAHTPGQRPVDPLDALAGLLLTAGIGAQQIPPGLAARSAKWRDYLAGRKILLVLDDAASHEQVAPLLPGSAGSAVLVTSRRHLTALEGTTAISLDTLPPEEAATLLSRLSGRPDLAATAESAEQLTRLCGYLPLAIGMLARQLHHHPAWTAADLAAELAGTVNRLELMRTENLSVAAAFDLSYRDLTTDQQRLFRRLGGHPGTDIDAYAAAALDGTDLATARRNLDGLYDHHLLTEQVRGRYRLHDLIREHARDLACAHDTADADAAVGRLLDYYAHTATAAGGHIETRNISVGPPLPGNPPAFAPLLSTAAQASAWIETELANLHAAAGLAATTGRTGPAIAIPAAISGYLFTAGHWDQSVLLHQAALAAARQAGDRRGEAGAHNELGLLHRATGNHTAATAGHQQALDLYRDLGDRLGQASALDNLGRLQLATGDYPAAAASHRQALALYRDLGHRTGQALAGTSLGNVQARTAQYADAAAGHRQALDIFRELGHRLGQALAIGNLGTVQAQTGDYPGATASLTRSLAISRDLGHQLNQALVLVNLGAVQRSAEDYPAAIASQQQALAIFRDLGDRRGQAIATSNLGILQTLTGDDVTATATLKQALEMYRDLGDRGGQAAVLNDLGKALFRSADDHQARTHHAEALALAQQINAPLEEARALEGLSHCLLRDGNPTEAAVHQQQAQAIFRRIGAPFEAEHKGSPE